MDVIKEIRRAFHKFMDGRITRAELEERLRELEAGEKAQASLPLIRKGGGVMDCPKCSADVEFHGLDWYCPACGAYGHVQPWMMRKEEEEAA